MCFGILPWTVDTVTGPLLVAGLTVTQSIRLSVSVTTLPVLPYSWYVHMYA